MGQQDSQILFRERYAAEARSSADSAQASRQRSGSQSWNEIGLGLLGVDAVAAEDLYRWAIGEAQRIEQEKGTLLKKGIEYCNLGVGLKNQGRVREAYRYFELAEREDHAWGDASHAGINVLEGHLLLPAGDELVGLVNTFAQDAGLDVAEVERAREFWVQDQPCRTPPAPRGVTGLPSLQRRH